MQTQCYVKGNVLYFVYTFFIMFKTFLCFQFEYNVMLMNISYLEFPVSRGCCRLIFKKGIC